jgi:cardiolipin synthase
MPELFPVNQSHSGRESNHRASPPELVSSKGMDISATASWLPTVDAGYRRMLAAIDAARDSLQLETYVFKPGSPGDQFRDALTAAAGRGAAVRVLLDGFGSGGLPERYWDGLRAAGGEAELFNPVALDRIAIRNHCKLLVVDNRCAFLGGFNIAPEYVGDGVERGWRDLGLALEGAPAACLAASFDLMWNHRAFRHPRGSRLRRSRLKRLLRACESAQVMATGPGLGRNTFRAALLRSLHGAREVQIVAAYFVPGFRLRRALVRVARRGGRVRLLLAGRTDFALAQTAGRLFYASLLRSGIEIAEYQPQILHAKLAIVDDAVFAGSANLDARSLDINYEVMVRLTDPALVDGGRALFAADWARAREIRLEPWLRSRTWADRWAGIAAEFLLTKVDPWVARRQLRALS